MPYMKNLIYIFIIISIKFLLFYSLNQIDKIKTHVILLYKLNNHITDM